MRNAAVAFGGISFRVVLKSWCGAVLLLSALGIAHAALFDDDEARKQIGVERQRIDELNKQQQAIDARLAKIEEALKTQPVLDLFTQIEALKLDMNKLRGQIEVLNNNLENTAKRQRDMYIDLDTRLRRFEQAGIAPAAPGVASPPASAAPATPPGTTPPAGKPSASAPASTPGAPGTAQPAVAAATPDPAAESRNYEAAQGQRRIGNFQGAIVAFQNFIKLYPKSALAPRAQYWIGDSYFNLRDFKLAITAQQVLIKTYPDSPSVPDAMLNIASSQIEMGESLAGRKTLEDLITKFPISDAAEKGKRRLAALAGPTPVSPPPTTATSGAPASTPPVNRK